MLSYGKSAVISVVLPYGVSTAISGLSAMLPCVHERHMIARALDFSAHGCYGGTRFSERSIFQTHDYRIMSASALPSASAVVLSGRRLGFGHENRPVPRLSAPVLRPASHLFTVNACLYATIHVCEH